MKVFRMIAGYILVIFPPAYGLNLIMVPSAFFDRFSPGTPNVVAVTLVLVMILSMLFAFGMYLLKKK